MLLNIDIYKQPKHSGLLQWTVDQNGIQYVNMRTRVYSTHPPQSATQVATEAHTSREIGEPRHRAADSPKKPCHPVTGLPNDCYA